LNHQLYVCAPLEAHRLKSPVREGVPPNGGLQVLTPTLPHAKILEITKIRYGEWNTYAHRVEDVVRGTQLIDDSLPLSFVAQITQVFVWSGGCRTMTSTTRQAAGRKQ
jgi:hypothetical protein